MSDIVDRIASKFTSGNDVPVDSARITADEWSALLAHIQRGAVPEGNERDEWETVVFTLMGHAASLYFLGQSDMPNWFYELAEKLARRHVDEALADRVREVGVQQRAAVAAVPAPAEVPMPEPDTHCYDEDERRDVWSHSADQMRTYGAACRAREAAGYARGLRELLDCRTCRNYTRDGCIQTAQCADGDGYRRATPIRFWSAALRGEVK